MTKGSQSLFLLAKQLSIQEERLLVETWDSSQISSNLHRIPLKKILTT